MESTQSDSSPQEGKEVLAAGLVLFSFKSGSSAPALEPVNALIDSIGECQEPFTKTISESDVNKQQSRLLIPKLDFKNFIQPLLKDNADLEMGVPVQTFNTAGKAHPMKFKKWSGSKGHVLMDDWNKFVEENQLKPCDSLTIQAFRAVQTGKLCFLISSKKVQALE